MHLKSPPFSTRLQMKGKGQYDKIMINCFSQLFFFFFLNEYDENVCLVFIT